MRVILQEKVQEKAKMGKVIKTIRLYLAEL